MSLPLSLIPLKVSLIYCYASADCRCSYMAFFNYLFPSRTGSDSSNSFEIVIRHAHCAWTPDLTAQNHLKSRLDSVCALCMDTGSDSSNSFEIAIRQRMRIAHCALLSAADQNVALLNLLCIFKKLILFLDFDKSLSSGSISASNLIFNQ